MLEVLQVPLIEMEYQNEQILTLASNEINALEIGNRSLWHFADGGFGHQVNGDGEAWLWQTKWMSGLTVTQFHQVVITLQWPIVVALL